MVAGALVKATRELNIRRVYIVLDLEMGFQNRTKTERIVYDGLKTLTIVKGLSNLKPLIHYFKKNFTQR